MPELPEVETVARSLRARVLGRVVTSTARSSKPLRRPLSATQLASLRGATITTVERHAKYLLVHTSSGRSLVGHLGMSGQMLVRPRGEARPPHTHAVLELDGVDELWFVDPRRFGQLSVVATDRLAARPELAALGPDPFSARFTIDFLVEELRGRRAPLKSVLLDQRVFAGMGNIYVAEALFRARLSPRRAAAGLSRAQIAALHSATLAVLEQGIANRGTSISDYVDVNGQVGDNESFLQVYGRAGEPCVVCGAPIARLVQSGRSTFFCRRCQR